MACYYTFYWSQDTVRQNTYHGDWAYWAAGNGFTKRGIYPGDYLFFVTVAQGQLGLLGALQVAHIYKRDTWALLLGASPSRLWAGDEFAVAGKSTRLDYTRQVPLTVTRQIQCYQGEETVGLKFTEPERVHLDRQTLRAMRELTAASAQLLNGLLDEFVEVSQEEMARNWH